MVLCMEQHRLKQEESALRSRVTYETLRAGWMKTNHEENDRDLFHRSLLRRGQGLVFGVRKEACCTGECRATLRWCR
jgi:hypothetical protein